MIDVKNTYMKFMYFTFYSTFIMDPHNSHLPVGPVAQMVEHCTGITKGSSPIQNCKHHLHWNSFTDECVVQHNDYNNKSHHEFSLIFNTFALLLLMAPPEEGLKEKKNNAIKSEK